MYVSRLQNAPQGWLDLIFSAKSAQNGGVVRRNISWVEKEIGRQTFENGVRDRGFHLIETGNQFIFICHRGEIRLCF
jgi:hypothetical protein